MNPYLAKLRGLSRPSEPSKPSKPRAGGAPEKITTTWMGIEGFEGDRSRRASGDGGGQRYGNLLTALQSKCPELVEHDRWQQAIRDADGFLTTWGEQARALGWTARDLFSLHPVPERPVANYQRLARYDETGLIWLLRGRPECNVARRAAA